MEPTKPSPTFLRKNITLSPEIHARALQIMHVRACAEFSELITVLIREEYERRGLIPARPAPDEAVLRTLANYKVAKRKKAN